jgi:aspartyl-tRNA(Asn)/glutamyl-tRNA(Gln) amidotransferase subunit A
MVAGSSLLPPPADALPYASIPSLVDAHLQGRTTVLATVQSCFDGIAAKDAGTHAVVSLFRDAALQQAAAWDARLEGDQRAARSLPLLGLPVLVKDNIAVQGGHLQCGSRILEGYECPFDATVVSRLRQAGAILVGYTNMDEFAMGSSCERSCYGATLNPYDSLRVPGGSSGGGAAATALGLTTVSLGSDTGGSVRQPASYCNVFGFKPSYGAVSRFGLVAFGSSLDQIGPFARSMDDLISLFKVVHGPDDRDATTRPCYAEGVLHAGLSVHNQEGPALVDLPRLRVGVPRNLIQRVASSEVWASFLSFIDSLAEQGCQLIDVEMPFLDAALPTYYLLSSAEASSNLARFDGLKYGRRVDAEDRETSVKLARSQGFGEEVKRRICLGTFALSSGYYDAYYGKAMLVRRHLRQGYEREFQRCDVILSPTTPSVAFRRGENLSDAVKMYANDVLTIPPSLAGIPALSMPVGGAGLPVGMQVVAPLFRDGFLLALGSTLESLGLCGVRGIAGAVMRGGRS